MESKADFLKKKALEGDNFNAMVEKTFSEADIRGLGFLEFPEFRCIINGINATLQIPPAPEEFVQNEFKRIAKNADKINKKEYRTLLKEIIEFSIDLLLLE